MGLVLSLVRLRYRLFGQFLEQSTTTVEVHGMRLTIDPGVFNPVLHLSGPAVVEMLDSSVVPAGGRVLDLGTGSGLLAIRAARWAREVVGVDISEAAARCARANVENLELEDVVTIRHGPMFQPVAGERFDLVVSNPPYEIDAGAQPEQHNFASPDFFAQLADGLAGHLAAGGALAMALPAADLEPIRILQAAGHHCVRWRSTATIAGDMTLWRIAPE